MTLDELFKLPSIRAKLRYKNTIQYSFVDQDGDEIVGGYNLKQLFDSQERLDSAIATYMRMVDFYIDRRDHTFGYLRDLAFYVAGEPVNDVKLLVEGCLIKLENYLKSIVRTAVTNGPAIITAMEGNRQALNHLINTIGQRAESRFFSDKALPLLESLRYQRNEEAHALRICSTHDILAMHLLVCMLHLVDYNGEKLNAEFTRHENRRLSSNTPEAESAESKAAILQNYVKDLQLICRKYLLDNVHVDSPDRMMPLKIQSYSTRESVDAVSIADIDEPLSIMLGAPGAGKTTMLHAIMLRAAARYLENPETEPVPVLIYFKDVSHGDTFHDMLARSFKHKEVPEHIAAEIFAQGRLFVAIDGLNEFVVDKASVNGFLTGMFNAMSAHPDNRYIITGRIYEFSLVRDLVRRNTSASIYEMQGVTLQMIKDYIGNLQLSVAVKTSLYGLLVKPEMLQLLTSPLNFAAAITVVRLGNDFNIDNRGRLMQKFIDETKIENDKIGWMMLCRLAAYFKEHQCTSILEYDFMSLLLAEDPNLYRDAETINDCLQRLAWAEIISAGSGIIEFKIDTYREYFVARSMADKFSSERSLPDIGLTDKTDFETLRMMIELLDKPYKGRDLVEKLYDKGSGERPVLDIATCPALERLSPVLLPAARLVSTLPYEIDNKRHPGAKALVEGWVLNHFRLLRAMRASAESAGGKAAEDYDRLVIKVIETAAVLSTHDLYLRIFDPVWLTPLQGNKGQWLKRIADILVKNCSDSAQLYSILSDTILNMGMVPDVHSLARECRDRFFTALSPVSLELLHRSIAQTFTAGDSRHDYAARISDYFLSALLTADASVIGSLDFKLIISHDVTLHHNAFNRLLQRYGHPDEAAVLFSDSMMEYYATTPATYYYILSYLTFRGAVGLVTQQLEKPVSARLLGKKLHRLCDLLPVSQIPQRLLDKLYDTQMINTMIQGAGGRDPWRPLKLSSDQLGQMFRHTVSMFEVPAKRQPVVRSLEYTVAGYDREGRIGVLAPPLQDHACLTGRNAIIYVDRQPHNFTIESSRRFDLTVCELTMRSVSRRSLPSHGYLTLNNSSLGVKKRVYYSMVVHQDGNLVKIRITDPASVAQLLNPRIQEQLMTPSVILSIDSIRLSLVALRRTVDTGNYTYIIFKPSDDDRIILDSERLFPLNDDGSHVELASADVFVAPGTKFDGYSVIMLDRDKCAMTLAIVNPEVENICKGLWLRCGYYLARVTADSHRASGMLRYRTIRLGRLIPLHGTASFAGLGAAEYFATPTAEPGIYDMTFVTDGIAADDLRAYLVQYADICIGTDDLVVQQICEPEVTGPVTLVETDITFAGDADINRWLAGEPLAVSQPRQVDNSPVAEPSRYKTAVVPYTIIPTGEISIPLPECPLIFTNYIFRPLRSGLACRVTKYRRPDNKSDRRIFLTIVRCDNGLKPRFDQHDCLRIEPVGNEKRLPVYSRLMPLVDFEMPERYHSSIAEILYDEIVNYNIRLRPSTVTFFKKLGMSHLLVADGRFDRWFAGCETDMPLIDIAVITTRPTDVVRFITSKFGGTTSDMRTALRPGDMVVVECTGRIERIERTLPVCEAFGVYAGTVVAQERDMTVIVKMSGRKHRLRNLSGAKVSPGMTVNFILDNKNGCYIMFNPCDNE